MVAAKIPASRSNGAHGGIFSDSHHIASAVIATASLANSGRHVRHFHRYLNHRQAGTLYRLVRPEYAVPGQRLDDRDCRRHDGIATVLAPPRRSPFTAMGATYGNAGFLCGQRIVQFFSLQGIACSVLSGLLYGCGSGGVLMTLWALAAASVRSGRAATSATNIFGVLTFSSKTALAFAALGIGEFLAHADYRFSHSRDMIRFMSALPAASAMVCFALTYFLFVRRSSRH